MLFRSYFLQVGSVGLLQGLSSLVFSVEDFSVVDGVAAFVVDVAVVVDFVAGSVVVAGLGAGVTGLVACVITGTVAVGGFGATVGVVFFGGANN